jgi:DNA modification methylase
VLPTLDAESVQCCVTSPPYYGLRDYGAAGQIGLEKTPDEYVAELVAVFREVRRALSYDGTCWINLGDSYAAGGNGVGPGKQLTNVGSHLPRKKAPDGLKPKDLVGIPWMVAFALRADGWYLRSEIIWHKLNPMPESVSDRPTCAHEKVFLLSKRARYFYDADAIREPLSPVSVQRLRQDVDGQTGSARANGGGKTNGSIHEGGRPH